MTVEARVKVKGMDKSRVDMIVHGVAVIKVLMEKAGLKRFTICDKALREGMVYDFMEKNRKTLKIEAEQPDVRRRSVVTLLSKYPILKSHSEQTARLSLLLFDTLKKVHRLGESDRELLEFAALLHDIGYQISFHRHHKHSFYLILNSDLFGFSQKEQELIAWVSRFHRRAFGKNDRDFKRIPASDQSRIYKLAAILRLADALDHSHFSLVKNLSAKAGVKQVQLILDAGKDAQWEIHEARQRKDLFEKCFRKKIDFKMKAG